MIALILAAIIQVFTLVQSPPGLTSTFPLTGYTTDAGGNKLVSTSPPTLGYNSDGDTVELAFTSPVTGVCAAGDIVNVDGKKLAVSLGVIKINKGATAIASLPLPSEDEIVAHGGTYNGYTVYVVCTDSKTDKSTYSNVYHINPIKSKAV
jgi:hypothetical protein